MLMRCHDNADISVYYTPAISVAVVKITIVHNMVRYYRGYQINILI